MPKCTKFKDIPKFTKSGHYEVNQSLRHFAQYIKEMQDEYSLQLNPDFQRGHVWSEQQQIKYMEFFLRGGKTGRIIYLNSPSWMQWSTTDNNSYDEFVCVDGLQRITAALQFLDNKIKVFGSFYKEYQDKPSHDFIININDLKTRREVLQWYIELNDGGTPHTSKEINRVRLMLEQDCNN